MRADTIPAELKALPQWVCWRETERDGKPTKEPMQATKQMEKASTSDPATWRSFKAALKSMEHHGYDGVGFVLTKDDPYIGIDIDKTDPHVSDGMGDLPYTYAEYSPNGGIHLIGRGTLPIEGTGKHPRGFGIFQHTRFFTMTGDLLDGAIQPIIDIQDYIDAMWPRWFPPKIRADAPHSGWAPSDAEVLDRLETDANHERFHALFSRGETGDYTSTSEADLALCSMIAFYTQDADQIDRIFRRSSLMRPKWEREGYREETIARALDRPAYFTPPGNTASGVTVFRSGQEPPEPGENAPENGSETPEIAVFNMTDLGNARRMAHHHGETIRYVHAWGKWLIWDGTRWAVDDNEAIMRLAADTVSRIYAEAGAVSDSDHRKKLAGWAIQSESAKRMRDMVQICRSLDGISVAVSALDRDPGLLNVLNGTINLRTGTLRPHAASDLLTKRIDLPWDPSASSPAFLAFLTEIMAGDDDLVAFLQRALGYSLTGEINERAMFVLHGAGRNGKSTLVETVNAVMGDYAQHSPVEMILARKGESLVPNDIARLPGIRFSHCAETNDGDRLDESKIKDITGGEHLSARFMRGEWFDFFPAFKLWFGTNHKPVIRGTDNAIWDRIRLIPFTVRIPDDQVDPNLREKLLRESPGILAWMVEGAVQWYSHRLSAPASVIVATSGYRSEMDHVSAFLSEEMVLDPAGFALSGDLYSQYKTWCEEMGEHPVSQKRLGNRLVERGCEVKNHGPQRRKTWFGIRARTAMDDLHVVQPQRSGT